jgi:plasmid stabilization system protein ParE
MAYSVEVAEPALADMAEWADFIAADAPNQAAKWLNELWDLIFSLEEMPERFAVIPEARKLGHPFRSARHYSHRIIYRIEEEAKTVYVVRIYHGARRPLSKRTIEP